MSGLKVVRTLCRGGFDGRTALQNGIGSAQSLPVEKRKRRGAVRNAIPPAALGRQAFFARLRLMPSRRLLFSSAPWARWLVKERKKKKGKENAPGSSSAATLRGDPAARRVKAASKGTGREARRPSLSGGAEDERSKPAAWGKPGRIEPVGFRARRILQVGSRGIRKGRFRRNALLQSGSKEFKPRHLANLLIMLP